MKALIKNYLATIRKHIPVTVLNLLGMSAAFIAFALILMQVNFELGFDKFRPAADRLYRVEAYFNGMGYGPLASRAEADKFMTVSPNVESGALFYRQWPVKAKVQEGTAQAAYDYTISYVSESFPETLQFEITEGTGDLSDMSSVLIPRSMAERMFGRGGALGRRIEAGGDFRSIDGRTDYYVSGVYEDIPRNSVIENSFFIGEGDHEMDMHGNRNHTVFLRLDNASAKESVEELLNRGIRRDRRPDNGELAIRLQKVSDLYFSEINWIDADNNRKAGSKNVTYIFLLIAGLVLSIAVINFLNFSVAQVPMRVGGINLQKILGSNVAMLRAGMFLESVLFCIAAYAIALLGIFLVGKSSLFAYMSADMSLGANLPVVFGVFGIAVAMGLAVAVYPALYATSLPPALTIHGSFSLTAKGKSLRNALIGFQYVVSIGLIIAAVYMNMQYRLVSHTDLGFNKEHVIAMRITPESMTRREALRLELEKNPYINTVSFSDNGFFGNDNQEGWSIDNPLNPSEMLRLNMRGVDEGFIPMMEMDIVEGRGFTAADNGFGRGDEVCRVVINRRAQQLYGLEVGDKLYELEIVGVVDDFNYRSLHMEVEPIALHMIGPRPWSGALYVKANTDDYKSLREYVSAAAVRIDPANREMPEPYFLDSYIENMYRTDSQNARLITFFSILAIIMSLSGVFSLINFEIGFKRREIGVRRVFGATVEEILVMFNRTFVKMVALCFVIAAPLALYGINRWLMSYSVKVPIYWWVPVLVLGLVMGITALSVTWLSYRTATENPVSSLRRD